MLAPDEQRRSQSHHSTCESQLITGLWGRVAAVHVRVGMDRSYQTEGKTQDCGEPVAANLHGGFGGGDAETCAPQGVRARRVPIQLVGLHKYNIAALAYIAQCLAVKRGNRSAVEHRHILNGWQDRREHWSDGDDCSLRAALHDF